MLTTGAFGIPFDANNSKAKKRRPNEHDYKKERRRRRILHPFSEKSFFCLLNINVGRSGFFANIVEKDVCDT